MAEENSVKTESDTGQQIQNNNIHPQVLNQTLGQILQNNSQAQNIIMNAMQLNPEQLQQMLNQTGNNQLMNMTIGDLFKNGIIQQATSQQVSPQQFQQMMSSIQPNQDEVQMQGGQSLPIQTDQQSKPSLLQKIKSWLF